MIYAFIDESLQEVDVKGMYPDVSKHRGQQLAIAYLNECEIRWVKSFSLTAALRKYHKQWT